MLDEPKPLNHESSGPRGALLTERELATGGNIRALLILNSGSSPAEYDLSNLLSERKTVLLSPLRPLSRLRVGLSGCVITMSDGPMLGAAGRDARRAPDRVVLVFLVRVVLVLRLRGTVLVLLVLLVFDVLVGMIKDQ